MVKTETFFEYDLPANEWVEFQAEGFIMPVVGMIYRTGTPIRGVPLGGIGTGFMHLGPDGFLDRYTAFNRYLAEGCCMGATNTGKRLSPCEAPLLGLTVGDSVWILALPKERRRTGFQTLSSSKSDRVLHYADELHYWGHYPITDMEFETTAPVRVGARVWAPFILGDSEASNTPGIVIEVRLYNASDAPQCGSVIANFPGFSELEAKLGIHGSAVQLGTGTEYPHQELHGDLNGVAVHYEQDEYQNQIGYVLGVIGEHPTHIGRHLGLSLHAGRGVQIDEDAWSQAASHLPEVDPCHPGRALAVDFKLAPGELHTLRFVLSWFAPFWQARHSYVMEYCPGTNPYTHKYYDRFKSEIDVAFYLAREHDRLLDRILGWQEAIYTTPDFPAWLKDSLINVLSIIPQNSFWAKSRVPDHWAGGDGLFSMTESLVTCPQQQCIPCDFFGNFPILFFFPDLAYRSLKAFTVRQRENGEIPFAMGAGIELDMPYYGVQHSTDSQVYVHLVARLWQRTGDPGVIREFYPSVVKAIRFLQTVDKDNDGIVDVWGGSQFYEGSRMRGASVYVGGLWLATLRLASHMAEEMDDQAFKEECQAWFERGRTTLETVLWNEGAGSYYISRQPATGWCSDAILSDQLVGEWVTHLHGIAGIHASERVRRVQDTIWKINVPGCDVGVHTMMFPNRSPHRGGYVTAYGTTTPAMLEMYAGDDARGKELVRRLWNHIAKKGWIWDQPSHYPADGERPGDHDHDYYHNTMLWAVPAAWLKQDLTAFCAPNGYIDRIIRRAILNRTA